MANAGRATSRLGRGLGLVLSGGGARGAFQVGVYQQILEERSGERPSVISGTSAGAINALLVAAGKDPDELLRFWRSLADDPPVVASDAFMRDALGSVLALLVHEPVRWLGSWDLIVRALRRSLHHIPPRRGAFAAWLLEAALTARFEAIDEVLGHVRSSAVFETGLLRARLVDELGGETVRPRQGIEVALNTVDARTGKVVRFVTKAPRHDPNGEYQVVEALTVDMALASSSIPVLFAPVALGDRLLWDGGVLVNTPLSPMVELGAHEIVPVLVTEAPDVRLRAFAHVGDALERAVDTFLENTYNIDRKLLLERNKLAHGNARYRDVKLYVAIRPERSEKLTLGSYLDFGRRTIDAMVDAGRSATATWLEQGPKVDSIEESERAPHDSVPPPN